jgi:hypothetical protein
VTYVNSSAKSASATPPMNQMTPAGRLIEESMFWITAKILTLPTVDFGFRVNGQRKGKKHNGIDNNSMKSR